MPHTAHGHDEARRLWLGTLMQQPRRTGFDIAFEKITYAFYPVPPPVPTEFLSQEHQTPTLMLGLTNRIKSDILSEYQKTPLASAQSNDDPTSRPGMKLPNTTHATDSFTTPTTAPKSAPASMRQPAEAQRTHFTPQVTRTPLPLGGRSTMPLTNGSRSYTKRYLAEEYMSLLKRPGSRSDSNSTKFDTTSPRQQRQTDMPRQPLAIRYHNHLASLLPRLTSPWVTLHQVS